jgi:alginate O-acetyltransferase complex protein AlgI
VCLAWCFFRLTNLADSLACLRKLFAPDWSRPLIGGGADPALWLLLAAYGLATAFACLLSRGAPLPVAVARMNARERTSGLLWGGSLALMTLALLLNPGGQSQPFIYFQF